MKTLIKWSASTIISFLVICFFSILLTGHTISEESSKLGKTVYSAGNAVTYDKKWMSLSACRRTGTGILPIPETACPNI